MARLGKTLARDRRRNVERKRAENFDNGDLQSVGLTPPGVIPLGTATNNYQTMDYEGVS
jgi:hypothetical protein